MQTIIYTTLALSLLNLLCMVVALARLSGLKSSSTDISSQNFDRLENRMAEANKNTRQELTENAAQLRKELADNMTAFRQETHKSTQEQREEFARSMQRFQEAFDNSTGKSVEAQKERFAELDKRQKELLDATEKKLEDIRLMVDEKLQNTLNERLGQSFKVVSEQLENVQKGLGEMKNLASDVGGLKNALTNVKVRGNFGELQLKALLEQMLSPEQYDENVVTIPGSTERVEFAVKLPGRNDSKSAVYLPIDSKFPKDVYDQYIDAIDAGDTAVVKAKSQQFETTITKMAKDICTKYVSIPHTTDFAIMFVPVENIYAEVIRRPKLAQELRDRYHILVTGPTTLGALLSSLQMGFRTLAIERRSTEVWETLGAVKTEFSTFGGLLAKAKKNLDSAAETIEKLQGTRTKAINRKLREVETLPMDQATALLGKFENADEEENEDNKE